ncbi:MAG: phosphonate C-P lyase system protein PhnG [Candidatus Puniceispirillum sp. TMED52]|nr:phosphonate C-P lyase system protein PhnG [SAR116 cluster bacterium]OUU50076.1 MAG: phosphonate C-P lyase system protein PhnG [Candidatus Puniceispirillum sp. TMED52]
MMDRKMWLSLLAQSSSEDVKTLWDKAGITCDSEIIRAAEIGAVMVQGRQGGTGAPFHLGEMSVTRCSIKIAEGYIGHGYHQGRSKETAETIAKLDALLQTDKFELILKSVLKPLEKLVQEKQYSLAAKAAATKVDFFTLVRGED